MQFGTSRLVLLASFGLASLLAACQGNLGSGSGLAIPPAPQYNQPGAPGGVGTASQSRQRTLDGAVYLAPEMKEIPLPTVDGYAVTIALGTPTPVPSPSPTVTAKANARAKGATRTKTHALSVAATQSASPAPVEPSASPSPVPTQSNTPMDATQTHGAIPATSPSARAAHASPTTAIPKTTTRTVIYPDKAPVAPTPIPSGNVQTFPVRKAIVQGSILPAEPLLLYGLGAIRFTIPRAEQATGRGFTVAVFAMGRHHRETLVAFDALPTLADNAVASTHVEPLALKKGTGYTLVLYGDELAPAPGGVPAGYASPGHNPFVTPDPNGAAGPTSAPGVGIGNSPQSFTSTAQPNLATPTSLR